MKADIGFLAALTEYEAGWGQRPDGYILADTEEAGKLLKNKIESYGSYECFTRASEFQQVILTPEGVNLLQKNVAEEILSKDLYLYIKK